MTCGRLTLAILFFSILAVHASAQEPVALRITAADGATTVVEAPATRWFDGRREISVEGTVAGEVAKVELDPERLYADVDSSDDIWTP